MKRLVTVLLFAGAGLAAMAQAPFTIFRPADGAKVRETVHVKIPKDSVPPDGYLGIFIGGKFVEATLPPLDPTGKYYEYDLDTKARGIPDGQLTLEAVLYVDYADKPRIVNRTSVQVTVANTADNTIPPSGLKLVYKWIPGTQLVYDYSRRQRLEETDIQERALGGKPITTTHDLEQFRVLYAVDNAFPDGSAVVHMQALPLRGKDWIMAISMASPLEPTRFVQDQLYPIYQHLKADGLELWGSVPFNLPLEGTAGSGPEGPFYADLPLPTLPDKPVTVGNPWFARFQQGDLDHIDASEWHTVDSVVSHYPARGEFKGVEWEMGHPCAKIVDTIAQAVPSEESARLAAEGQESAGPKISVTETIWFALDRRQILKVVRDVTEERQVEVENGFGGASDSSGASSSGSTGKAGLPPTSGLLAGGGAGHLPPPSSDYQGQAGVPPSQGQLGAPGTTRGGGLGRQGAGGRVGGGSRTVSKTITTEETYILEL